jgi:23S rRNA (uracil1939-C5)-methyltransferase
MSWPDEIELELTGIAQGGAAVGRFEGRVVFAYGGLPGELVRVRLQARRASFADGEVLAVLRPSPHRIAPRDASATHADWQFIAYAEQPRLKAQIVAEQLAHLGGLEDVAVKPTLPAPEPWGYRNTATLHGDPSGALGYFRPGTRTVEDRASDPLLVPALNAALAALRATLGEDTPMRWLRSLTLRANRRGQVLGIIEPSAGTLPQLQALALAWARRAPALAGVLARKWEQPLRGEAALGETMAGVRLRVSAGSFFQVNSAQAEAMVELARAWIAPQPGMQVVDAYCGVGTFALPLAAAGAAVLGIEAHAGSLADAEASARAQGLRLELRRGAVEEVLPTLAGPIDAALLDPPRRGCAPEALAALEALGPRRIVYVSCHPGTLARDVRLLAGYGYRLLRVQPVDMFPQTHHVEALALLER